MSKARSQFHKNADMKLGKKLKIIAKLNWFPLRRYIFQVFSNMNIKTNIFQTVQTSERTSESRTNPLTGALYDKNAGEKERIARQQLHKMKLKYVENSGHTKIGRTSLLRESLTFLLFGSLLLSSRDHLIICETLPARVPILALFYKNGGEVRTTGEIDDVHIG